MTRIKSGEVFGKKQEKVVFSLAWNKIKRKHKKVSSKKTN